MLYAINERKEHRVHAPGGPYSLDECIVQADADGWIPWLPCHDAVHPLPRGVPIEVRRRDGCIVRRSSSETFSWCELDNGYTIEAYRPILDDKEKDMSEREWPQTGDMAEVHNEPGYGLVYGDDVIGADVQVKARFRSGCVDMAAVEHDGMCFCFRVDMLRPIRTAAHRAEDEAVGAMWAAWERGDRKGGRPQTMREIYTAIREGRIPGVKLEN